MSENNVKQNSIVHFPEINQRRNQLIEDVEKAALGILQKKKQLENEQKELNDHAESIGHKITYDNGNVLITKIQKDESE